MKYKLISVLLLGLSLSSPVWAAGNSNWYVALDMGQANHKDGCTGSPVPCKRTDKVFTDAYRVGLGYSFTPNWSVEADYGQYGQTSFLGLGDTKVSGWMLSGIGTVSFSDTVSMFAKLNVVRAETKNNVNRTKSYTNSVGLGLGVQYNISKSLGIRAQYDDMGPIGDSATTGRTPIDMLTIGAVYRF